MTKSGVRAFFYGLMSVLVGVNLLYILNYLGYHHSFFRCIKNIYDFSSLIFPVLAFLLGLLCSLLWYFRGKPRHALYMAALSYTFFAVPLGVRIYATHIEPYRLSVHKFVVKSEKVSKTLRIVHISDIQSSQVGEYEQTVYSTIASLHPDIVLFTGDLLQLIPPANYKDELPKMVRLLDSLHPPLGIYGVWGDTDFPTRAMTTKSIGTMRMLVNENVALNMDGIKLNIWGLDVGNSRKPDTMPIAEWLAASSADEFTILLGHAPDYILTMQSFAIDLCLAGHTHGGQIVLPWIGPLVTLSRIPRKMARGCHRAGKTYIHVSAGIGCEHMAGLPAIRFNCPPEISLIEIRQERD